MTTIEIISAIEALRAEVIAIKEAADKAGQNPSWLEVARGALAKGIEQIGLHQQQVEKSAAAEKK